MYSRVGGKVVVCETGARRETCVVRGAQGRLKARAHVQAVGGEADVLGQSGGTRTPVTAAQGSSLA